MTIRVSEWGLVALMLTALSLKLLLISHGFGMVIASAAVGTAATLFLEEITFKKP